ncbi:MAG: Maf family nucleotide pyrophosphatase [Gammaproteobacteria bacterium]|nr:Maf family nucleotide pyrophosphatase [Gammaproteobacteria bacterium]
MTSSTTKIILASSSVYRKELLGRLHIPFETASPDVDETQLTGETPSELVRRLSLIKAQAIAASNPDAIIIGSDQVASCEGTILGKPGNYDNAVKQLKMVSGKTVIFHTGLSVLDANAKSVQTEEEQIHVEFKTLSEECIKSYLEKEPAFNCAGSFKSEGLGIALTQRISENDPTALIGLPLIKLTQMLENIRYPVL